ncbi:hypothetical protein ZIOFF_027918 [Zingiber officinale]|uniref:ATP synthase subunit epsilon, mitochondrial n=1 Tax=Zingiber officinale TaxID=94328 RepID=A0A8J5GU61_ZINOF|nr:hypothetical protein ZIOFF_027918 [Zingiber officinale]
MASSGAAVPFWRAAGMTYISYSNICASLVRSCLKEPHRSNAANREKVHFAISKWSNGKPESPSESPLSLLMYNFYALRFIVLFGSADIFIKSSLSFNLLVTVVPMSQISLPLY